MDAIAAGQSMEPLLAKLREEEDRKKSLIQELERLSVADQVTFLDAVKLKREVKARLADTRDLLSRHIAGSRRLLRTLLRASVTV